jgi:hypothetical protein
LPILAADVIRQDYMSWFHTEAAFVVATGLALWRRSTFLFPLPRFIRDPTKFNSIEFPSWRFPILQDREARAAWGLTKFAAYFCVASPFIKHIYKLESDRIQIEISQDPVLKESQLSRDLDYRALWFMKNRALSSLSTRLDDILRRVCTKSNQPCTCPGTPHNRP